MLRSFVVLGFFGSVVLAGTGCHGRVRVQEMRGPDGAGEWKRISCPHLDRRCFATARSMCPGGYYFAKEGRRGEASQAAGAPRVTTLPPEDKWGSEMYSRKPGTLLVRCAESVPTG